MSPNFWLVLTNTLLVCINNWLVICLFLDKVHESYKTLLKQLDSCTSLLWMHQIFLCSLEKTEPARPTDKIYSELKNETSSLNTEIFDCDLFSTYLYVISYEPVDKPASPPLSVVFILNQVVLCKLYKWAISSSLTIPVNMY